MRGLLLICIMGCASPLATPPLRAQGQRVIVEAGARVTLARASWEVRGPVVYHSDALTEQSPVVQWWVMAHERCHLESPLRSEVDADCCALRWTREALGYGRPELAELVVTVHGWKPSKRHPSGSARVVALLECAEEMGL